MRVAVIGAGKMGLPLACQFASRGAHVLACDVRPDLVAAINRGECPIDEPGVPELLAGVVREGRLRATTGTPAAVAESEVIVVIVPALLTPEPDADISILAAVSEQIAEGLRPRSMVSYETTLPVGCTRRHFLPILERSGLWAGTDFDVVFSPERVKSQLVLDHLTRTPKVVGGLTPAAAERAGDFYGRYLGAPVINVGSLEAAELVKLAGMLYRDVNIALSNELARYAEAVGVDLHRVIAAVNNDGEANLLQPGIGVGGHCTPVYPYFLIRDAERQGFPATLAERSRRINDDQARHILDRLERHWKSLRGRRVLILGLAFRPRVKEHILSPAFLLAEELRRRGADVRLHDPLYDDDDLRGHGFTPGSLDDRPAPEVVILNTAHPEHAGLDLAALAASGVAAVVDGRASWSPEAAHRAGLIYVGVGRPDPPAPAATKATVVPIAQPVLAGAEAEAAARVIRSGWVTQGPEVAAFEREFAAAVGAEHARAVSSGTTALHLALQAVGVGPGDEVITASHSFIATANSICYTGATPVFVDIQPGTFNIDPTLIERAITGRTRAILCVHQLGMPCELAGILAIAHRHGLPVIEDAACAIGSEILVDGRWEKIGRPHGDIACFSFHPRKVLTTGDGGMITTPNAEWDRRFCLWRQHGMDVPDTVRHGSREVVFEAYSTLGYNYRLTDLQAAVGREQLKRLPEIIARRRLLAERYQGMLAGVPGIIAPEEPGWARSNWQSYCIGLPDGCDQRRVMQALLDVGVSSRRGVMCAHREPAYDTEPWSCGAGPGPCGCAPRSCRRLGRSERAQDHTIVLPLFHRMTEADQEAVVAALKAAVA
jgi:nucleotide sugar dehydrogenase